MRKKKAVTIDDLAGMVQRGFIDVEKRLGKRFDELERKMDQRFSELENRITGLENRMTELESRMSNLELRMNGLDGRMDSLEEFNEEVIERLGRIERLVDEDQQERIKRLESSMQSVFERLAINKAV